MTIYYVSPYTTTNGTGTWASPYSTSSNIRSTPIAGDEIRVVAKPLTTLLLPTVYTATLTAFNTLTITAGGGLGADFSTSTVCYLPQYDTFFRVLTVSTNNITIGTNACLPVYNSSVNTGIIVQRVDATQIPATSASQYLAAQMANGVTVTDGWIADGVQILDGSAKSLLSSTPSVLTVYLDGFSSTLVARTNVTINLPNTVVVPGISTSGIATVRICSSGADVTIGQIQNPNSGTASIQIGGTTQIAIGGSITVINMGATQPLAGIYARDLSITFVNTAIRYGDFLLYTNSTTLPLYLSHCNITFNNVVSGGSGSSSTYFYGTSLNSNSVTVTGTMDCYGSLGTAAVAGIWGDWSLTFGPFVSIYHARRVTSVTSFPYKFQVSPIQVEGNSQITVPTIDPGPITITTDNLQLANTSIFNSSLLLESNFHKNPLTFRIEVPNIPTAITRYPQSYSLSRNILLTVKGGGFPVEILGIDSSPYSAVIPPSSSPIVSQDSSVFRTTGPSLKTALSTRSATYWPIHARAIKTIRIPVVGGLSYTISGYVRTNVSGFADGHCRMGIVFNNLDVTGQDITTAAFNAWEPFSLAFVAAYTGEAILTWEMYFQNSGIMWLDDLTIS